MEDNKRFCVVCGKWFTSTIFLDIKCPQCKRLDERAMKDKMRKTFNIYR